MKILSDLSISHFISLQKIIIKKEALINLNSFTISDNPCLTSIELESGSDSLNGALNNVHLIIISSIITIT